MVVVVGWAVGRRRGARAMGSEMAGREGLIWREITPLTRLTIDSFLILTRVAVTVGRRLSTQKQPKAERWYEGEM